MDDFEFPHEVEGVEELDGEDSDLFFWKPLEVVGCHEFVEVVLEEFEDDALVKGGVTMCFRKIVKSFIFTIPLRPSLSFSAI